MSERQLHRSASGVFAAFSCALDVPRSPRVAGSRVCGLSGLVSLCACRQSPYIRYTEVVRALGLVDNKQIVPATFGPVASSAL